MKTKIYLTAFAFVAFAIFSGCSKKDDNSNTNPNNPANTPAPVAGFTYSGNGYAPSTVTFTNSSTNATSYSWDFGDNGTSTDASPSHSFTTGGVFTVKLTATGAGGNNSITKTVNIQTPPTVAKITYIKLTAFPPLDPSCTCSWDISNGPDIYFVMEDQSSNHLADYSSVIWTDMSSGQLPKQLNLSGTWTVPNLHANYYVELFDYDSGSSDDDMGYVGFRMDTYTTYPSSISITNNALGISVTLGVNWQ